ncbi:flagellar basal body L-ring protein FlgH [Ideonella sp. DXS22W]|uniref:Flagellar L-ring protein n=1 Tax=Pseudaquabacterium inlustre TaxID=2984192 RepID=A0ABU9CM38_9BURK
MRGHRFPAGPWRRAVLQGLLPAVAAGLGGCASTPESAITLPVTAAPRAAPPNVEPVLTGSLFRPDQPGALLFTSERRARTVGDTVKVDIAETLAAHSRHTADNQRESKLTAKGPGSGASSLPSAMRGLLNMDANASGSDSFKGDGQAEASNSFKGRLTATVINVLSNGNLVVAGERVVRLSSGATTLRFSGVVDPSDIRPGNVVASGDIADARFEALASGELGDSARRSWLQRVLTESLRVW